MSVVRSIGTALPPRSIGQAAAGAIAARLMGLSERRSRALCALYASSGVERRHLCVLDEAGAMPALQPGADGRGPTTEERLELYAQWAPQLAHEACTRALSRAECAAGSIDHLVLASCTGMRSPGVDHALIESLGLRADVQRTGIGFMGCHAAVNALSAADALAERHGSRVLVCCVEVCSVHFQHQPGPGGATANALFADGAAACVVEPGDTGLVLEALSSQHFPGSAEDMTWRVGSHGFEMTLSPKVPGLLERGVRAWIEPWLRREGLCLDEVSAWIVHPGGPRIVECTLGGLDVDDTVSERACALSLGTLARLGNMSSSTVLHMMASMGPVPDGGVVVMLAFGPGLTGEAALFRSKCRTIAGADAEFHGDLR